MRADVADERVRCAAVWALLDVLLLVGGLLVFLLDDFRRLSRHFYDLAAAVFFKSRAAIETLVGNKRNLCAARGAAFQFLFGVGLEPIGECGVYVVVDFLIRYAGLQRLDDDGLSLLEGKDAVLQREGGEVDDMLWYCHGISFLLFTMLS